MGGCGLRTAEVGVPLARLVQAVVGVDCVGFRAKEETDMREWDW
jgi:hypothetical protein